jgi:hypothetical protein
MPFLKTPNCWTALQMKNNQYHTGKGIDDNILGVQNRVDRVLAVLRHALEHSHVLLVEVDEINSELTTLIFVLISQLVRPIT